MNASLATEGNRGVQLLRRADGERIEFVTITLWESLEAVGRFAGAEPDRAVFYPRGRAVPRRPRADRGALRGRRLARKRPHHMGLHRLLFSSTRAATRRHADGIAKRERDERGRENGRRGRGATSRKGYELTQERACRRRVQSIIDVGRAARYVARDRGPGDDVRLGRVRPTKFGPPGSP
jgi:hypothetical protein